MVSKAATKQQTVRPLLIYLQNTKVSNREKAVIKMIKQRQKSDQERKKQFGSS